MSNCCGFVLSKTIESDLLIKSAAQFNEKIQIEVQALDDTQWPIGLEVVFPGKYAGIKGFIELAEFISNNFSVMVICECDERMINGINESDPYYGLLVNNGNWLLVSTINCQFMSAELGESGNNPTVVMGELSKDGILSGKYNINDFL